MNHFKLFTLSSPSFFFQRSLFYCFILFFFAHSAYINAQNPDELQISNTVDADTTSEDELGSDFVLRVDYQSKVLSSGRDFGVSQYGFSPSLTYYHKSGLYGGVTGSFYSQSSPKYSLTDFNIGYSNVFNFAQSWSYMVSYDRYLFNPDSDGLLKNAGTVFTNYDFGPINGGVSYTIMFSNEEIAHRLNPSIGGYFTIRHVGFIDKISFAPSVSATIGTSNVPFIKLGKRTYTAGQGYDIEELAAFREIVKLGLKLQYRQARKKNAELTPSQFLESRNLPVPQADSNTYFGLMSWNFSIPIKFKVGNFALGVTYNYVIPVALPNETYDSLPNQSYIGANISYTFSTK
jgi:hypothetical protein